MWKWLSCFSLFTVGKDAVELAAPLFRFSAMGGNPDGMYSYGKLLETGYNTSMNLSNLGVTF